MNEELRAELRRRVGVGLGPLAEYLASMAELYAPESLACRLFMIMGICTPNSGHSYPRS
jgi:hypothetical protein